mmetsp:Transcript_53132/g.84795  ORF Transcript_53132/g.84795 Transcript_53132/m.84795 type:complete len:227 (+) Transcript_53132:1734-2414(+)
MWWSSLAGIGKYKSVATPISSVCGWYNTRSQYTAISRIASFCSPSDTAMLSICALRFASLSNHHSFCSSSYTAMRLLFSSGTGIASSSFASAYAGFSRTASGSGSGGASNPVTCDAVLNIASLQSSSFSFISFSCARSSAFLASTADDISRSTPSCRSLTACCRDSNDRSAFARAASSDSDLSFAASYKFFIFNTSAIRPFNSSMAARLRFFKSSTFFASSTNAFS